MSDTSSQKGQFEPIHAAHAIEQVVFALQFDRPIEDAMFAEVRKAAEQFKSELPGQIEIQGFALMLTTAGPVPNAGFLFRRVAPDGTVENELRVDNSSVTFRTMLYTRWDAVWSQASKFFKALVPIYATQVRISGISINYVDKFAWSGNLTACKPSLLLRAESKYLCPHVFEAKDFWHSHTGAFIRVDNNTKRLLNVNVDYLDENRSGEVSRVVAITTVLTDQLNQPGYDPYVAEGSDIIKFVDDHMQGMHVFGKSVFGNIINDEMSRRIALIE